MNGLPTPGQEVVVFLKENAHYPVVGTFDSAVVTDNHVPVTIVVVVGLRMVFVPWERVDRIEVPLGEPEERCPACRGVHWSRDAAHRCAESVESVDARDRREVGLVGRRDVG